MRTLAGWPRFAAAEETSEAMFYETLGRLLTQASEDLEVATHSADDPRRERQLRQIATLLRRTGAIWPRLFDAVECECGLLETAWSEVCAAFEANGVALPATFDPTSKTDRLAHHTALEKALDDVVRALGETEAPWARAAAGELRNRLAEVEAFRGELVDAMFAA